MRFLKKAEYAFMLICVFIFIGGMTSKFDNPTPERMNRYIRTMFLTGSYALGSILYKYDVWKENNK